MMLKKKILLGYGVVSALMGLMVVWTVFNLLSLGKTPNTILDENYHSILAAANMVDTLERQDSGILLMILDDVQEGITLFRKNEAEFLTWLSRAKDNITIEEESEVIQKIEDDYAAYRQLFFAITDFPKTDRTPPNTLTRNYEEKIQPLFTLIRQNCDQLRKLNEQRMAIAATSVQRSANRTIWMMVLFLSVALITLVIFGWLTIDRIFSSINKLTEATNKISAGDYAEALPVDQTGDELYRMTHSFNHMIGEIGIIHQQLSGRIELEKQKGDALLTCIDDGLVIFNTDLTVNDINPAAKRMLFLTSAETAPFNCSDILKNTPICGLLSQIIESGHQLNVPEEQRIVTLSQNDQFRHYLYSTTAIYNSENKTVGVVLLLRDITRLKEVERLKNEFILAASHELRTPLTSLGMSIDSLRKQVAEHLSDQEKKLLQTAHEEVHRMKALVNDLLDLSKIESGRIAIEFESVPIPTLFEYVQKVFKSQLERKSVALTGELASDLPNIRADANKITWVLSNLISNALRYVDNGGHIQFIANRIGPQVHLSVRDDGPGIPLDYQSKIFQKYVQVKGQESGGTGLGLAICKEIVRAHGGGIWVESLPGQGSTFTVTLPVAH